MTNKIKVHIYTNNNIVCLFMLNTINTRQNT